MDWVQLGIIALKVIGIFAFIGVMIPGLVWLERKIVGHMQQRIGPHRVGPDGLLQPIADGLKLLLKEDIIPRDADAATYLLAPILAFVPAVLVFAVVPFGETVIIAGVQVSLHLSDINIGVLYLLALGSLGVYGVVLAGWSANSSYSLLGGARSAAQMISYELPLGLALVTPLMIVGSFNLVDIVQWQRDNVWLVGPGVVAFAVYMIAAIAEANRAPFDLPEAEQELIAGYHTEYSGFKFAMFYMGEYAHMVGVSAIAVTVFLGGWDGPWLPASFGWVWFLVKLGLVLFAFIWLRATLPRLRYDQLMRFGWLRLVPLALISIGLTAVGLGVVNHWF